MEKIAVIGVSCLLPGADNPQKFWQNLIEQKDSTSLATATEIGVDPHTFYDPVKGQPDKYYCMRGGYIRDFTFDPTGYSFSPEALAGLDNIFKWSLYVARQALQDSGYLGHPSALADCGLILGNLSFPTRSSHRLLAPIYKQILEPVLSKLIKQPVGLPSLPARGNLSPYNAMTFGYPAAIVSQALSLSGENFALDAACASSLYAVKLACHYLLSGQTNLMLAGAVSCADPFSINMGFSVFQAYPDNGISRPLDRTSGGLIAGEGAGMFVLKRYNDALRDGDKIYAVIRGIGLSNDGRGKFLLSPRSKGQLLAFERAYAEAGLDPQTIDYVECHATGTPLGDKTELATMETFFGQYGAAPLIGSVKSNFGHLLTAAGMPSMLKLILSMSNGVIPATINVTDPFSSAHDVISTKHIVTKPTPWPTNRSNRRAGVNAFGFGGTNAHLIFEAPLQLRSNSNLSNKDQPGQSKIQNPKPVLSPVEVSETRMAITGMDAFFGQGEGLEAFGRTIYEGRQHFRPIPRQRWKGAESQAGLLSKYGFSEGKAPLGAFIQDFEFDFLRFGIPPNDIDQPLPQQLLILKVADNALQDASLQEGQNVAVIVAMSTELAVHQLRGRCDLSWQLREALSTLGISLSSSEQTELESMVKDSLHPTARVNQYTSFIGNIMASRIAAQWDFSGPAFTVSADENSTVKALQVAQLLLAAGEVEAVLVGAVDLAGSLENVFLRQQLAAINDGNPTLSYDRQATGWLIGEGAGAVVLKRLDTVRTDQERIYAVIEAISLIHETGSVADGISVPRYPAIETVQRACADAMNRAGVRPTDIDYLEVFGSGIPSENNAELAGLLIAYGAEQSDKHHCALGSVKANIGHTFAASGMASLIKTALCLHHRYIPATPNWSGPKAVAGWHVSNSPFYVPPQSCPWFSPESSDRIGQSRRIAALNSLGSDGACGHVILSDAPKQKGYVHSYLTDTPPYLFLLSGDNQDALLEQSVSLQREVEACDSLLAVAHDRWQSYRSKSQVEYVLALVGANKESLIQEIQFVKQSIGPAFEHGQDWHTPSGSYFAAQPLGKQGAVSFVYPGAFNAYPGLGRELFHLFPELDDHFTKLAKDPGRVLGAKFLYPRSLEALSPQQAATTAANLMSNAPQMIETGMSFALLFTRVLQKYFEVQPQSAFGYSLGESAMMISLGIWPVDPQHSLRLHASPLFGERLSGAKNAVREYWGVPPVTTPMAEEIWQIYILNAPVEAVNTAVNANSRVYLTHINTPVEVVIAGFPPDCLKVIDTLGCDYVPAPFSYVLHCAPMRSEYQGFLTLNTLPVQQVPEIDFYFAADRGSEPLTRASIARRITQGVCQPLDFPKLVRRVYDGGARIFVELGPRSTCSRWISQILKGNPYAALAINHRNLDDRTSLIHMLARLASHQVPLDLSALYDQALIETTDKKSWKKTITLGGPRIADSILTMDNMMRFGALSLRPISPAISSSKTDGLLDAKEIQDSSKVEHIAITSTPSVTIKEQVGLHSQIVSDHKDKAVRQPFSPEILGDYIKLSIENHRTLLRTQRGGLQQLSKLIELQIKTAEQYLQALSNDSTSLASQQDESHAGRDILATPEQVKPGTAGPLAKQDDLAPQRFEPKEALRPADHVWDEADLLEFAQGQIANVFGQEYAIIDTYARRVRLPMLPYLLVSRVTKLEARRGQYKPSFIQTEYDIPQNAWYLVDGQVPLAVAVESGQCDLLLISYLGIDFENKGQLVYRLLDCTLTFLADLPKAGDTLRYDIRINSFARSGDNLLFFFSYECFVSDRMILKMDGGCAGFFSDQDLEHGKGIIVTEKEKTERRLIQKSRFEPLLACYKSRFDRQDLLQLSQGNLAACFGIAYDQPGLNSSLRFPQQAMLMMDRVTSVDVGAGAWGLGLIIAEKDLAPQDWYFPCHFKDDQVLAGSLMAEGCAQLLQFYLLYLGVQRCTHDARFQPIPNLPQVVRCRGQVTPVHRRLTYRMEVTEIGLTPQPYAKANVDIIVAGKVIVDFKDLGLQLSEKEPASPLPNHHRAQLKGLAAKTASFNEYHIAEFASGSIPNCFGSDYNIYLDRRAPRTPNGDLQLISRVLSIDAERLNFDNNPSLVSEYDAPVDPWFCRQNSFPAVPYSIYMELGLQPCGFLSAHLGSTLPFPHEDFYFRNLDGDGHLLRDIDVRGQTITNQVQLLSSTALQGVIIQKFAYELACEGDPFFRGEAVFGYFTASALANQVGMDGGDTVLPWCKQKNVGHAATGFVSRGRRHTLNQTKPNKPYYHLAQDQLSFLDEFLIIEGGGHHDQGYIYGSKQVDPKDWFFSCHFYQDPVMPGSLGVEAIVEAMQIFALEQDLGRHLNSPRFSQRCGHKTVWKYRGQIVPTHRMMDLEIHISQLEINLQQVTIVGDASLWRDGTRIYEVSQVAISLVEAEDNY